MPDYATSTEAISDYNGKSNTAKIVAAHNSVGINTFNSAAIACNHYKTLGTNAGDWYLPAAGELSSYVGGNFNVIQSTFSKLGSSWLPNSWWSSTENSDSTAWLVESFNGDMEAVTKNSNMDHRCFYAL